MSEMAPEAYVPDAVTGLLCAVNGGHRVPTPPARICPNCETQLRDWLRAIPDHYTLLPTFLEHGTTDRNPDSKATKRSEAAAPMRLEIVDLLDHRLGRKWLGTATTDDRRGVLGTLLAIAHEIHDGRQLTGDLPTNVTAACDYIHRHLLWVAEQDWVGDAYAEIKALHRTLSDAVGIYRPRPVGRCHLPQEETEEPCGGPLLANKAGGVRCPRCEAEWEADKLRLLGAALASQETA